MTANAVKKRKRVAKRETVRRLQGVLFTLPVIVGIVVFSYIPAVQAFIYSLFKYDGFKTAQYIGFKNYADLFSVDRETGKVFLNTFLYAFVSVPLSLVLGYLVALLVNNKLRGVSAFRTLFYLPVIIPGVAAAVLWRDLFNSEFGVINRIFGAFGAHSLFFESEKTALATLLFTGVWGVGGSMIIWLAAFKNIPAELYESAKIDGANAFTRVVKITLPLSTPMIFYNLVLSVIGSLQVFNTFIIAGGSGGRGPENSLYFIALKIYNDAFTRGGRMGYASALGMALFAVIGLLILLVFKTNKWVTYTE
ncbi:MAG: sugar ABC transporter permease [Clostridiales bacterium]|nr:sugar ABC transporter permease [Clostridiales bacterium]